MICQANMYKSSDRQSLRTSQIVQSALLNNKGIRSDHVGSLLQSDIALSLENISRVSSHDSYSPGISMKKRR